LCPLCGTQPESTGHIIWECASATAVWMECSKKIQKLAIAVDDGFHVSMMIVQQLNTKELMLFSWLAHRIWLRWNSVVFGGKLSHPTLLIQTTMESMETFLQAQQLPPSGSEPLSRQIWHLWRRPPESVSKLNWDAALHKETGTMGCGSDYLKFRGSCLVSLCSTFFFYYGSCHC
jgi:hypothetical protein